MHPAIVAFEMDGAPLDPDLFGPFWILDPYDADPSLDDELHHARSIYQLKSLRVN